MQLRPGYKQTNLGVIPEDWEVRPLGELATVTAGGTPRRTNARYWNGDIPWVTTSEVDFCNIDHAAQFITKDGLLNSAAKVFPSGTLLMALYGQGKTRGKVAILGIEAATNQACAAIALKPDVCREFMFHFLANSYGAIRNLSNTGNQENLTSTLVRSILVVLPSHIEQRAIAAALSDADTLLDGLDRLIAKKRDLKKGAMQQLMTGQTRLPGFFGIWELKRVDQVGDVLAGKALAVHAAGRLRPYLRTRNVLDGRIDLEDVLEMPMTDPEFERFQLLPGDVLLNEGQSLELVGRCSMYRGELSRPCVMQNQLLRFRARAGTSSAYAEHVFRHCQHTGVFAAIATQTTSVAHLGSTRFGSLQLRWPRELDEQRAIAAVLSDMDSEIVSIEKRRDKTRDLKQAMMQELLTGKTRLV